MSNEFNIKLLVPDEIGTVWDQVEPLIAASVGGNEISRDSLTAQGVRELLTNGTAALFIGYTDTDTIRAALVLQFCEEGGKLGAQVIALGGSELLGFKNRYWRFVLQWLQANGCTFLDAHVDMKRAGVFIEKFGFGKSCAMVRMDL